MEGYSTQQLNSIRSNIKAQLYKGQLDKVQLNKDDIVLISIVANYLQKCGLTATFNTLQSECELIPTSEDLGDIYSDYRTNYTVNYDIQHLQQYYQSLLKDIEQKHALELLKKEEYYKQLQFKLQRDYESYKQMYKQQPAQNTFLLENIQHEILELKSSVLELQMKKDPYLYELEHIKQLLHQNQNPQPQPFSPQTGKIQHTIQMNEILKQQLDQQILVSKELQRELADVKYLAHTAPNEKFEDASHLGINQSSSRVNSIKSDISQNELRLLRRKSVDKINKNTAYDLSSAELKLLKKEPFEVENRDGVSPDISTQELKLLRKPQDSPSPLKNSSKNVSFSTNDQQFGEEPQDVKSGKHVVISAVDEQIDDLHLSNVEKTVQIQESPIIEIPKERKDAIPQVNGILMQEQPVSVGSTKKTEDISW